MLLGCLAGAAVFGLPTASAVAGEGNFCDELVPPHTDCANNPGHIWDYWNGVIFYAVVYYPGSGEVSVCQHDYRRDTGKTVFDACAPLGVESGTELNFYYESHIELSAHGGNNSSVNHTIDGKVSF